MVRISISQAAFEAVAATLPRRDHTRGKQ